MTDVLVADDDQRIAQLHAKLLERAGFMVTVVDNGLAAFAALQQQRYRAIVCDIQMPFLEGTRLYDQIREEFPEAAGRVVFVTGWAHDAETRKFLEQTGQPYLPKPVDFEKLVATVTRVVERPFAEA
ncbi:MAG: response regulator [Gemmatimonadales bacterium]|jgi:DNA-binding response OmpR family regulator